MSITTRVGIGIDLDLVDAFDLTGTPELTGNFVTSTIDEEEAFVISSDGAYVTF